MTDEKKSISRLMAEELVNVQPMSKEVGKALMDLMECGKSPEWLKANGYRPVSRLGLMWVKEKKQDV